MVNKIAFVYITKNKKSIKVNCLYNSLNYFILYFKENQVKGRQVIFKFILL